MSNTTWALSPDAAGKCCCSTRWARADSKLPDPNLFAKADPKTTCPTRVKAIRPTTHRRSTRRRCVWQKRARRPRRVEERAREVIVALHRIHRWVVHVLSNIRILPNISTQRELMAPGARRPEEGTRVDGGAHGRRSWPP